MLIKIIKCLLVTILIFIGIFILAFIIEILKNMIGETAVMLLFFSIVSFGVVFSLVWTTLFWRSDDMLNFINWLTTSLNYYKIISVLNKRKGMILNA